MATESSYLAGLHIVGIARPASAAGWCLDLSVQLGAQVERLSADTDLDSLGRRASGYDVVVVDSDVVPTAEFGRLVSELNRLADNEAIIAIFSPYGVDGPLAVRRGSELTVQACCGIMSTNGYPGDPPLMAGVPAIGAASAVLGLAAIASAVFRQEGDSWASSAGEVIDISQFDVGFCMLGTLLPHVFLTGRSPARIGNRHPMSSPWNTYPTSDGWVVITTIGEPMWRTLAKLVDTSLLSDQRYADTASRIRHCDELDARISTWTKGMTTAEVMAAASEVGVPAGDIRTLREALDAAIAGRSPVVRRAESGVEVGLPMRLSPVLASGTQRGARQPAGAGGRPVVPTMPGPLTGIRVVEVGSLTSAPLAGRFLGAMGADVVKVEPPSGDMSRHLAEQVEGVGYLYYVNNTDKRSCVLDMRQQEGFDRFMALLAEADVFLTNLAPSSLTRLGLSQDTVCGLFPSIVYCSVSGYGISVQDGTDKAFDTVIQGRSGIMSLTGRSDGPPMKTGISYADVFGACVATAAVAVALRARNHNGRGTVADVAMLDAALWTAQGRWEAAIRGAPDGRRSGNRCSGRPVHDVFSCTDGLVAIDAADEDDWQRLCVVLGRATDRDDPHDVLVTETATRSMDAILAIANSASVCAAPVLQLAEVASHPHARERHLLVDQVGASAKSIRVLGMPLKFLRSGTGVRRPAPTLGEQPPRWT